MKRTFASTLAMSLAIVIWLPTAASAESLVHRDRRGDVYANNNGSDNPRLPSRTDGDVRQFRMRLTRRWFTVTAHFRSLSRPTLDKYGDTTSHTFSFSMKTDQHTTPYFDFDDYRGKSEINVYSGEADDACGSSGQISYRKATIHARVPSRCLGNPRWITVTFLSQFFDDEHFPNRGYADSGFNAQGLVGVGHSRRLHRG